ncbi:MAG: protein tyrosine phosphatase [Flavobacterium sp.]
MKNILFICSRNKWRSLTAETIYKNKAGINVRSAGTEDSARIKVNAKHLSWADVIFVMERHHKEKLIQNYPGETRHSTILILEIPDIYRYMDKELIEEIQISVDAFLENSDR